MTQAGIVWLSWGRRISQARVDVSRSWRGNLKESLGNVHRKMERKENKKRIEVNRCKTKWSSRKKDMKVKVESSQTKIRELRNLKEGANVSKRPLGANLNAVERGSNFVLQKRRETRENEGASE